MLFRSGVSEEELLAFPKGALLVRLAKKLHLLSDGKKRRRVKKKKKRRRKKKKGKESSVKKKSGKRE